MTIRGLNYFATIYRTYIQKNRLDIYGSSPVKLPAPQYIIFYNGEKELPDKSLSKTKVRYAICLIQIIQRKSFWQ